MRTSRGRSGQQEGRGKPTVHHTSQGPSVMSFFSIPDPGRYMTDKRPQPCHQKLDSSTRNKQENTRDIALSYMQSSSTGSRRGYGREKVFPRSKKKSKQGQERGRPWRPQTPLGESPGGKPGTGHDPLRRHKRVDYADSRRSDAQHDHVLQVGSSIGAAGRE